ncbi:hypothetical protein NQ176_g4406 [Zarea fungicola]|uniref:Uncharacterized protein n=1 Tax=Zarea fungicola TaxID=93591 RepID=A0ACC1NFT1_9HYPO|nr:hypothetical protein NQ176_g4406 [Lecanicillium fungicola]
MADIPDQPFHLSEQIHEDDIYPMAVLGHNAFLDDSHTNLKKHLVAERASVIDDSGIREWLQMPERCKVVKAINNQTGEIMGFICWAHRGYVSRATQSETVKGRFSDSVDEEKKKRTKIQIMEDMEDNHFVDFMTDIMPEGTKCWYVAGLSVATKFQRMGVARALLRFGTLRAEKDNVFAWVHSSQSAWKAYSSCGFQVVRVLRIDLDRYAEGDAIGKGPGNDGKWGVYTVRYMVYRPERIGSTGWPVISENEVESIALS